MLSYLKKFNSLPVGLRQKVSSQETMATIEALEKKYQFPLAALVMKVLVKEVAPEDLTKFLLKENLTETAASELSEELKEKVFSPLGDFLSAPLSGAPAESTAPNKFPAVAKDKPADEPQVKGASFFFSADDEAEIRELTQKIDTAERMELPAETIEEKLKAMIDRAQINFGSADLAERFKQILKIYLRGIRNKLETKLTLTKPFSSGGLSFDDASAQQVVDLADKILNSQPSEALKPLPKIKITLPEREAPYDFSKLTKEKKAPAPGAASASGLDNKSKPSPGEEDSGEIKSTSPEKIELAPLTPVTVKRTAETFKMPAPEKNFSRPLPKKEVKPIIQTRPAETSQVPPVRFRSRAESANLSQKIKIEDVKYVPKVMSPLDELKYLDLVNFRRLDKDPLRATNKIKDKIDLLAEESYARRLEGIRFWRSNPINRLYLEIGHMSISKNRPVDVIIEERKMAGSEYLTSEEFKAIMDLNKSLRF